MRRWIVLLMMVVSLTACQSPTHHLKSSSDKLIDTLRAYEISARWQPLQKLYGYLKPDEENPVEIPDNLDTVKVSHYEVINAPTQVGEDKVAQTVIIQYLHVDQQVVRRVTDQQIWEYNKDEKRWWRTNAIPAFE